jgi:transposase
MFYGFDVHKNFIQVCELSGDGKRRRDFRIEASAEAIEAFAKTLQRTDAVVLEATFHTWAIHSILSRYVERVAIANPIQVKAIAHAKIKTDKVDAHTLAQLLRTEFLPEVQLPSRKAWALRQLMAHRRQLLKRSTASKNAIHGVLNRSLVRYPERWLFTQKGFRWLKKLELPAVERLVLDHQIGLFHEIQARLKAVDQELLRHARLERDAKLLVTIPGVDVTVAIGLLAAIDSIERFASPQKLAAYFGLVPKVRQSAGTCHHGRITKAGSRSARWLAIEAAHTLARSSSPLAASYHRIRRRKNHQIAVTALARKLTVTVWHVLTKGEPYRYAAYPRTRSKLRKLNPAPRTGPRRPTPRNLEETYEQAGFELSPPTPGERRVARNNRIALKKLTRTPSPA